MLTLRRSALGAPKAGAVLVAPRRGSRARRLLSPAAAMKPSTQVDKSQFLMPLIGALAAATTIISALGYQVFTDLRNDVSDVKTDLRKDVSDVTTDLKADIANVSNQLDNLLASSVTNRVSALEAAAFTRR